MTSQQQKEVTMQFILSRQIESALVFHLMKFAFHIFEKKVAELTMEEYAETYLQACQEMALQEKILLSEAACGVVIPKQVLLASYSFLQAEHGGRKSFFRHLQKNNLQAADYLTALETDLRVEAILARVAFQSEPVSAQEIHDYYHSRHDPFCFPEQRRARHILICTESEDAQLPKEMLRQRAHSLHARLQKDSQATNEERAETFTREALLHSDATTACDGGDLGKISPGELCAVLDHTLFHLAAGEISPIIETAQGFHILFCEAIHPGARLNFQEACQQIHQILTRKKRITACKIWLKSLFHKNPDHAETR
jgi:peptidyl-prolyl cis-trans isomerase C